MNAKKNRKDASKPKTKWDSEQTYSRNQFEPNNAPPSHPNTKIVEKVLFSNREFFLKQMKELRDPKNGYVRQGVGMDHAIGKHKIYQQYWDARESKPEELGESMLPFVKALGIKSSGFVRPKLRMEEIFPGDRKEYQEPDSMNKENGVTSFKVINNDPELVDPERPFCHFVVDKDDKYLASSRYGGGAWGTVKEFPPVEGMMSKKLNSRLHVHANLPERRKIRFDSKPRSIKNQKKPGHTVRFGCNTRPRGHITPKVDGIYQHIETSDKGMMLEGRSGVGHKWTDHPSIHTDIEVEQLVGSTSLYLTTVRKMPFPNYWGLDGLKYFLEKYDFSFVTADGKEYKVDKVPEFDDKWIANCPYDGIIIKIGDLEFAYKFVKTADLDAATYKLALEEGWIVDMPPVGVYEYAFGFDEKAGKTTLSFLKPRPDKTDGNSWANIRRMPFDPDAYQILECMVEDETITDEAAQQIIQGYHDSQKGLWDVKASKWRRQGA